MNSLHSLVRSFGGNFQKRVMYPILTGGIIAIQGINTFFFILIIYPADAILFIILAQVEGGRTIQLGSAMHILFISTYLVGTY